MIFTAVNGFVDVLFARRASEESEHLCTWENEGPANLAGASA